MNFIHLDQKFKDSIASGNKKNFKLQLESGFKELAAYEDDGRLTQYHYEIVMEACLRPKSLPLIPILVDAGFNFSAIRSTTHVHAVHALAASNTDEDNIDLWIDTNRYLLQKFPDLLTMKDKYGWNAAVISSATIGNDPTFIKKLAFWVDEGGMIPQLSWRGNSIYFYALATLSREVLDGLTVEIEAMVRLLAPKGVQLTDTDRNLLKDDTVRLIESVELELVNKTLPSGSYTSAGGSMFKRRSSSKAFKAPNP